MAKVGLQFRNSGKIQGESIMGHNTDSRPSAELFDFAAQAKLHGREINPPPGSTRKGIVSGFRRATDLAARIAGALFKRQRPVRLSGGLAAEFAPHYSKFDAACD